MLKNWHLGLVDQNGMFYDMNQKLFAMLSDEPFYDGKMHLAGDFYGKDGHASIITREGMIAIKQNFAETVDGKKYLLANKSPYYKAFEVAVEEHMPILYHFCFGVDQKKQLWLSGHLYQNNVLSYVQDRIMAQDLRTSTLSLQNFGQVFVDWGSMHDLQRLKLAKYQVRPNWMETQLDFRNIDTDAVFQASYQNEAFMKPKADFQANPIYQYCRK